MPTQLASFNSEIWCPLKMFELVILLLSISKWCCYGVQWISDLLLEGKSCSREVLVKKFEVPNTKNFSMLQIHNFLFTSPFLKTFIHPNAWHFLTILPCPSRGISFFYNLLQNKIAFTKANPILKWEMDLNAPFSASQLRKTLQYTYTTSDFVSNWELTHKLRKY